MEKKIKDYLHLYYDCYVMTPRGKGRFCVIGVAGHIGCGMYPGYAEFDPEEVKPVLRPLSDMDEDEIIEIAKMSDCLPTGWEETKLNYEINNTDHPNAGIEVCVMKRYAVRVTNKGAVYFYDYQKPHAAIFIPETFEIIKYLLSKHFDLFGLIESGLAIEKTESHAKEKQRTGERS